MNPFKTCITFFCCFLMLSCQQNSTDTSHITPISDLVEAYSGPIIDMHCHAFDDNSSFSAMLDQEMKNPLTGRSYMASATMEKLKEETFAKYQEHNIVKAMVSQGALWYDDAPELVLIGNSHFASIEELREQHSAGRLHVLGEVAPNYQGLLPTDEKLVPYFDLADELGIPIGYHMYPGGPPGGAYFAYPNTRAFQGKPLQLEEILLARPNMKIYIMHGGWPYLEDMKALMYAHPQVYIDVAVTNWAVPTKEFHHFLKGLVDAGYGKRIMFGTDQMIWVKTIDEAIEAVNSAPITLDQKADIFYHNAARFMALSKDEIASHHR